MSAVIQTEYTGNGTRVSYPFTFPYLKTSDIKASLDGVETTAFTLPNATTLQFNTAPSQDAKIKIFRQTGVDNLTATFYAGSAIKSEDLNDNFTQNLYKTQEVGGRFISNLGGTMTGDLNMGEDTVIKFEGATDNAHETTLTVADPTADRTITLPNVTGTVVTTGDTGTVATAMIAGDAVTNAKIADNSIDSEHYVDGSIDTAHIANSQVTTDKIADSNVTTAKIADDAVTNAKIAANAVDVSQLVSSSVTTVKINDDAVTNAKLATNSVDVSQLVSSAVTTIKINDDAVTQAKMANDSVGTAELIDGSVDTARLADNAVTLAKMADNSVGTTEIVNDAVTTAKIADSNVTTAKIANDAITEAKIADDAVGLHQIADAAVRTSHIADTQVTTAKIASSAVTTAKIASDAITTVKILDDAVTTGKIADSELKTLAGMQSGTASKLADSTALTADIADLNQIDGLTKQTTISNSDSSFPTSGAVVDYVAAQIAPLGGLEVIATEVAFPNTQPASGVVISISDAGGVVFNGSGTSTTGRTVGGSTVTITNAPSSLNNETLAAGVGLMVSSTGLGQVYHYHKILGKEEDIKQLSDDINDFNARYRVGSSNPTSALDAGDLFFNTSTSKLLVYNATNTAWEEAQSIGNFFISTLSPAFDSSTQNFTITNAPTNAEQIILSINGVIQKPNAGTSTPSEGFALDGSTVKLAAAPPTGSTYFAVVVGSTVNIGAPSDNTVSTAKLQNLSVTEAKIATDAVTHTKLANMQGNVNFNDTARAVFGGANDLQIVHTGTASQIIQIYSQPLQIDADALRLRSYTGNESYITANVNGQVKLYYDNSEKLATSNNGVGISGNIFITDSSNANNGRIVFGATSDLEIYHDGTNSIISNSTGRLELQGGELRLVSSGGAENILKGFENGAIQLYYDGAIKAETRSDGFEIKQHLTMGDSDEIRLGNSADLKIYHASNIDKIESNGTGMHIRQINNGDVHIHAGADSSSSNNRIVARSAGAAELYHSGTKRVETTTTGVKTLGDVSFRTSANNQTILYDESDGQLEFSDSVKAAFGTGSDLKVYHDGSHSYIDNEVGSFYIRDTGGAERVRINGYGTAITGGLLFGTDTATANALDDYEEGSFTPSLLVGGSDSGITYSYQQGQYVKIGRQVTINMYIALSNKGSNTGNIHLGNLPFAVTDTLAGTQHEASGSVGYISGLGTSAIFFTVTAVPSPSALMLTLLDSAKSATDHATQAHLSNSFGIRCSCTYFTTS